MGESLPVVGNVGIIDWGIGGVDFLRRLRGECPTLSTTYLSDSGFTPYGKVASPALAPRLEQVLDFLAEQGADAVVIACNAASSVLPQLRPRPELPVTGVIAPTLGALTDGASRDIAVLGGQRTIDSRAYEGPLADLGFQVRAVVAQPLSALVEAGELSGPAVDDAVRAICSGLRGVDTLVPACTHYVALLPALLAETQPRHVVDPASETLRWLQRAWDLSPTQPAATANPRNRAFPTGDPTRMRLSARRAFGFEWPDAAKNTGIAAVSKDLI